MFAVDSDINQYQLWTASKKEHIQKPYHRSSCGLHKSSFYTNELNMSNGFDQTFSFSVKYSVKIYGKIYLKSQRDCFQNRIYPCRYFPCPLSHKHKEAEKNRELY